MQNGYFKYELQFLTTCEINGHTLHFTLSTTYARWEIKVTYIYFCVVENVSNTKFVIKKFFENNVNAIFLPGAMKKTSDIKHFHFTALKNVCLAASLSRRFLIHEILHICRKRSKFGFVKIQLLMNKGFILRLSQVSLFIFVEFSI